MKTNNGNKKLFVMFRAELWIFSPQQFRRKITISKNVRENESRNNY